MPLPGERARPGRRFSRLAENAGVRLGRVTDWRTRLVKAKRFPNLTASTGQHQLTVWGHFFPLLRRAGAPKDSRGGCAPH